MDEKHSIKTVLEHYGAQNVPQGRIGWVKIRCPFHQDTHASAVVNLKDNGFICFGCGVKGDTYSIIMLQEGVKYREAIAFAEDITGESNESLSGLSARSRSLSRKKGTQSRGRSTLTPWRSA
jgi:DNA primase